MIARGGPGRGGHADEDAQAGDGTEVQRLPPGQVGDGSGDGTEFRWSGARKRSIIRREGRRAGTGAGASIAGVERILTLEDFAPAVGETFTLTAEGRQALPRLELVDARTIGEDAFKDRLPFTLLFRGPVDPALPQATYVFGHPRLGEEPIFIVPVARGAGGTDYEAVFV